MDDAYIRPLFANLVTYIAYVYFTGHREKANILCFHPLASDVLATSGYDGKILIWNMNKRQVEISLDPIQEPVRDIQLPLYVCVSSVVVSSFQWPGAKMVPSWPQWDETGASKSTILVVPPAP